MSSFKLSQLLHLDRHKVRVIPDREYLEIGIYSFFKGIFHKSPRKGWEVGDKDLYIIKENDFIFQITFAWEGAVAIASKKEDNLYGSVRFPTFRVDSDLCNPRYLLWWFQTKKGKQRLYEVSPGSALRNRVLNIKKLLETEITLPPLDLQNKLVSKLDNTRLKQQNINVILEQESKTLIPKLRQAILQEAVFGKLVPQDPKDEPASKLLNKIEAEKERSIREKKIKQDNHLQPITEEGIPCELPLGWEWAQIGEISEFLDNMRIPVSAEERERRISGKQVSELFPYYGANGQVGWIDDYIFDDELVLLAEDGGYFGNRNKSIVYRIHGKSWVNNHAHVLRSKQGIEIGYLQLVLNHCDVMPYVRGTTRLKLNQSDARKIRIPLAPSAEQKRIAEKVDKLMKLCDELELRIKKNQNDSELLMEAVLKEAFESREAFSVRSVKVKL